MLYRIIIMYDKLVMLSYNNYDLWWMGMLYIIWINYVCT